MSDDENTTPEEPRPTTESMKEFTDFLESLGMPEDMRNALTAMGEGMELGGAPVLFSKDVLGIPGDDPVGEREVVAMRVGVKYVPPERSEVRPIMIGAQPLVLVEPGWMDGPDGQGFPTMDVTISATHKKQALVALQSAIRAVEAFPEHYDHNPECNHDH